MKSLIKYTFVAALAGAIAASGTSFAQETPPRPTMSAASQSPGSLYVTYIASWINQVTKGFNGLSISQEPGGAAQNIVLVHNGDTDFGITNSLQGYQAVHGFGWTNGTVYDGIAALHAAYPAWLSIFTTANSDIRTLEDLEGREVAVGLPGSGSQVVSGALFEHLGINPGRTVTASWEDTGGMLRDGLVDAVFYLAGHPAGFIQELQIGRDLRFIPIGSDNIDSFLEEFPYYAQGVLPEGLYENVNEDIRTIGLMNFIFASPDLPDDFITTLLETVYANVDGLERGHPNFVNTNFENVRNIPIPFHPAAKRFYEEKGVPMNVAPAPK
ncbi:MAG: TAXI family TRAP transporter solute-binding subunit [Aquisalimonadaceae bacterium]